MATFFFFFGISRVHPFPPILFCFLKGEYLLFQQFSNHLFGFLHLYLLSCFTPQSRDQIYIWYELIFERMLQLMNKKMKFNQKPTTSKRGKNQFKLFSSMREDQRQLLPCPTITTPLRVPWHISIHSFPLPIVSILFCFYIFKE